MTAFLKAVITWNSMGNFYSVVNLKSANSPPPVCSILSGQNCCFQHVEQNETEILLCHITFEIILTLFFPYLLMLLRLYVNWRDFPSLQKTSFLVQPINRPLNVLLRILHEKKSLISSRLKWKNFWLFRFWFEVLSFILITKFSTCSS